jgi:signal transduction histidine kinase
MTMERLRILLLEDSRLDAELALTRLTEGGVASEVVRVETRADYVAELERDRFDLILADYSLPSFDGGSALAIARERCPEVPFIFVSGALGEELAIETLKDGATDYVLKQRLERLVPSIQRALREAEERAERRRLEEELCRRAEELAERDRRKDEFLAMLAHELRNPLGASSNALQLMRRRGPSDPALRQAITVMERQVQHQVRLGDDLLDVSRITRGKISLEREWLDLAWVIRHTVEDHRSVLEAAGLTLFLNLPQEPVWYAGDRTRLTQVLGNLLANAAKFTNAGGCVTVSLTLEAGGSQAALAVRDTGIGIDPQMLPHVFESFAQGDHSPERSRGGLGLGLALVKGLVELHGGAVRADSPGLGGGSAFALTLPLEGTSASCGEVAVPPGPPVRCCRILVVEDNRDAAETLRDVLELSGHEVALAFSGPEGVAAARSVRPEVVLCDLGLPGFDGYAVARAVRQDPATAAARLIALSGYGHEEDRRRSREAGFDQHLVKPVNFTELEGLLGAPPAERSGAGCDLP